MNSNFGCKTLATEEQIMRQEDLIEVLRQRPSQPFRIHLSDGIIYEFASRAGLAGRSKAVVFFPDPRKPPPALRR